MPTHRVGRGRRARRCRQPRLDAAARAVQQLPRPAFSWTGDAGSAAAIASALRGWNHLRVEITEDPTTSSKAYRYSYTPALGVYHAVTGLHGDIMIPEDRLKAAVVKAALGDTTLLIEIDMLLGKPSMSSRPSGTPARARRCGGSPRELVWRLVSKAEGRQRVGRIRNTPRCTRPTYWS